MADKKMYYLATFVGSLVGSYIPTFWGAGIFSLWSVVLGSLGALIGMYVVYKLF